MTSSVFIKTYHPDLKWLEWCFRFLKRNWETNSEFVVCCPNDCVDAVTGLQELLGHPINVAPMDQWIDKGYLHQQYMKMNADLYCSGDLITYIDSDAMLMFKTDVERDLCVGGNPIIWQTHYSLIHAPWQSVVSAIMCLQPQHEYMRCFPITYHRSTPKGCREHLENLHKKTLDQLVQHSRTWTEFNVMGFYARVFQSNLYVWKDTEEMFLQENTTHHWHERVRQFHNVIDWDSRTVPFLRDLYGGPVEESSVDTISGRVIKTPKAGQEALIAKVLPHITNGSFVIDVGAHEGLHSVAYAKAGANIISFEPNSQSFTKLWRNLYLVGGTAYPFAVSDSEGFVSLHEDKDCPEATYVSKEGETQVPCVSLDTFCESFFSDNPVRLIKIDVEGFEPMVLRGARKIIETYHPVIIIECQLQSLERNGFTKEDIEELLTGYDLEISTTDPRASVGEKYFYDIVAVYPVSEEIESPKPIIKKASKKHAGSI